MMQVIFNIIPALSLLQGCC